MEINYDKKRIVAFLDVMGFKELLAPNQSNLQKLNNYFNLIEAFRVFGFSPNEPASFPVDIMAVSDSVVMSVEIDSDWNNEKLLSVTAEFFKHLTTLQGSLALSGIWTRGAITIGDLYLNTEKSILVGQAFVNAYSLEQQANYPRVIIDPRILKIFSLSAPKFCKTVQALGAPILDFYPSETFDYGPDDFMQLDWFGSTLGDSIKIDQEQTRWSIVVRGSRFELFFTDLRERQHSSADIFLKSQKLLNYIHRAFWENIKRHGKHRSVDNLHIYEALQDLTGIQPFSPKDWKNNATDLKV